MRISIITVCFNSEETIRDTVESVLSQSYADIEFIVVDGLSKDRTMDIVREYSDRIDVIVSESDNGIYDAMNKGVKLASGDVIGMLNSDDVFYDADSVSKIAEGFSDGADGVYGDVMYVNRNDLSKNTRRFSSSGFSIKKIRFGIIVPHPTFYVKKKIYDSYGLYKTDYRVAADYELISRFLLSGLSVKRVPKCLVKMREGGISSTDFKGRVHQNFEIVRAIRENGLYTNIFLVMLKIPFKLLSYFRV